MKYFAGIDLGTTNTVIYHMEQNGPEDLKPSVLKIPQITDPGEIQEREQLPSFIYIPDEKELPAGAMALPWNKDLFWTTGEFAAKSSPQVPGKVISSSKSWLCSANVDKTARILPWNRNNEKLQMSPVDAAARILEHLREAWNASSLCNTEDDKLEKQSLVLTVPASFDAVARELTVKAAESAGLSPVLLEEPLAAFYSWLLENESTWRKELKAGDLVLVCDIGGGTSDFTLIKVNDENGNLGFERVAVGRHILLGGDNMDLTLAYYAANKLKTEKNISLDQYQISGLTHACRQAKEALLSESGEASRKLTVLGRGSSVIAKTISVEISKDEVVKVILDGFLPLCEKEEKAQTNIRAGLRTFGLSYESDPAISRHLAEFINRHISESRSFPKAVLFNGGVTKSPMVRTRIVELLDSWKAEELPSVRTLTGINPDLAVAQGACWYANVRAGKGIRIKSGSSHSYYIGVESNMPAIPGFMPPLQGLCLVPMGMEEGSEASVPYEGLALLVGESTEFRFFASTSRKEDQTGLLLNDITANDDCQELPKLTASLPPCENMPPGTLVPVKIKTELTETGTLNIWCENLNGEGRWKLEFELRSLQAQ